MTELTDKELAIKVAEKLGYYLNQSPLAQTGEEAIVVGNVMFGVQSYLHDAAARVLFAMPKEIRDEVAETFYEIADDELPEGVTGESDFVSRWLAELTPRKVLEVFIELEGV